VAFFIEKSQTPTKFFYLCCKLIVMSAQNPFDYYTDEDNHGSYSFIPLEQVVNNFTQNYLGDDTLHGNIPRSKVIYQAKQGIREFTFGALKSPKVVELELGDNLDIIIPYDYVDYIRISWVNKETGQIHPMSVNTKTPLGVAHLQDNSAEILFDNTGDILIGTTAIEHINDQLKHHNTDGFNDGGFYGAYGWGNWYSINQNWRLDTRLNANGTFNISPDGKRIHFSSESAERIILLEYISDGNELLEKDMKIHKYAEDALYAYINDRLSKNSIRLPDYEKRNIKRTYDTLYRNARVRLLGIKPQEFMQQWKASKTWIR
jgi:hypothetical protein